MNLQDRLNLVLTQNRPSRYTEKDSAWIEDAVDQFLAEQPPADPESIIRDHYITLARREEGKSTKSANNLMRFYGANGYLPADWRSYCSNPISIENEQIVGGKTVRVRERVKLAHATARDFALWKETEDRQRNRDYMARGVATEGAGRISHEIYSTSCLSFFAWAENYARVEDAAA